MTTTVGASTSYQLTLPALSETADIQVALKLLAYGQSADPTDNADIEPNSLVGYLKTNVATLTNSISTLTTNLATKSNIASPTFTGTVTLPTGSSSTIPLKFVSGTLKSSTTAGAMEFDGTSLYFTPSSTRKTLAFVGDAGYTLLSSGNYSGTAGSPTSYNVTSTDYRKLVLVVYVGTVGSCSNVVLTLNQTNTGNLYNYAYLRYSATPTWSGSSGGNGISISGAQAPVGGETIVVEILEPAIAGNKAISYQSRTAFGKGGIITSGMGSPVSTIDLQFNGAIPNNATYAIYGVK